MRKGVGNLSEMQSHSDTRIEKLYTKVEILEREYAALSERLKEQAGTLKEISEIARAVDRTTLTQQQMLEKIGDHEKRLEVIEQKPAKRWDNAVDKIIMLIIGAVLTYVLTKVGL